MERSRHRKSKGVHQIQKDKDLAGLYPDSPSYAHGQSRDHRYTLEMGQSSIGRSIGRETEMFKEMKPKGKSRGFISRLLGLEWVRSSRHVPRQEKVPSGSYQHNPVSINIQPNKQFNGSQSNRWGFVGLPVSKDEYGKLGSSHVMNQRYSSNWSASLMLSNSAMAPTQKQKVIDAKHLPEGKLIVEPKKLENTCNMSNSKDLLSKYQRKRNSSSPRNSHDLQGNPRSSWSSPLSVLKRSKSGIFEDSTKAWITKRGSSSKHSTSHLEREDGLLLEPNYHRRSSTSNIQYKEKDERVMPLTNIVVLKSNRANVQNSGMLSSLRGHSHGFVPNFQEISAYPRSDGGQNISWIKKIAYCNEGASKDAEEIAKEVTRRVRAHCEEIANAKSPLLKGYEADESSFDVEESDPDNDSEIFEVSPRNSFSYDEQCYRPPAAPVESVNREAKHKTPEKWKVTQNYHDLELVANGSSRGQMHAIPGAETRAVHLNAKGSLGGLNSQLGSNSGSAIWKGPSHIGNKDGWKGEILGTNSRLRLNSPIGSGSNRTCAHHDVLVKKKDKMFSDIMNYKGKSGDGTQKEKLASYDMKFRSKKPFPCYCQYINEITTLMQTNFEINMEANVKNLHPQHLTFQHDAEDDCRTSIASNMLIAEEESATLSSKPPQSHPEKSSGVDEDESAVSNEVDFCGQEQEKRQPEEGGLSSLQHPGMQLAASENSNEGEHTTVSVPYTECSPSVQQGQPEEDSSKLQLAASELSSEVDYSSHVSVPDVPFAEASSSMLKEQPEEGISSMQHAELQLAASEYSNEGDYNSPVAVPAVPSEEGLPSLLKGQPEKGASSMQHATSECLNEGDHNTPVSVLGVPFTTTSAPLQEEPPEISFSSLQHPQLQLAASKCSNEADHTTLVSVPGEVPITESASSNAANFERLSIEFHELRMQLLLRRMDPTSYEAFSLVAIEDSLGHISSILSEGYYAFGSNGWEVWYAFDILIHSGFEDSGFNIFMLKWHSPDTPLDPNLFNELEKKYGDDKFGTKPDRSLVFDRINIALFDIFQQHIDMHPWVMPKAAGRVLKKELARDAIKRMLGQESVAGTVPEKVMDREMQWTYFEEIEMVGIAIEDLFIGELVDEVVCDYCYSFINK